MSKVLASLIFFMAFTASYAQKAILITSQEGAYFKKVKVKKVKSATGEVIKIDTKATLHEIEGFGTAVSELGWEALSLLDDSKREQVFREIFDPNEGMGFNLIRVPIGASDFAKDWWSLNETAGDYAMENFSIERDRQYYLPYIKKAMEHNSSIKVWGSPWSPPSWMKQNDFFACRGSNDGFAEYTWGGCCDDMISKAYLKFDAQNQEAYALYFSKFVNAYRAEGIDLYAIHVQNEPFACQIFPSCLWKGEQLRDFIKGYLGPHFEKEGLLGNTEIWLGTINNGDITKYARPVLSDADAAKYVTGVGYQWDGKAAVEGTRKEFPDKKIMQTESECGNGLNSWEHAMYIGSLMNQYLNDGAGSYLYWNLVLNQFGMSNWMWRQNSMLTINTRTKDYAFNPEFYVMKHFAKFIPKGSKLLKLDGDKHDFSAYLTPEGSIVLIGRNEKEEEVSVTVEIESEKYQLQMKPQSINTLKIGL